MPNQYPNRLLALLSVAALYLLMSITKFWPGMGWLFELTWVLGVVLLLILSGLFTLKVDFWLAYVVGGSLYLVFSSAIAARAEFGQPLIYGILCQRQYLIGLYSAILYGLCHKESGRALVLSTLNSALPIAFWSSLVGFAILHLYGASWFANTPEIMENVTGRLRLESFLIVWGICYYVAILRNQWSYSGCFYVFLGTLYFLGLEQGRFNILAILSSVLLFLSWGRGGFGASIGYFLRTSVSLVIVGGFSLYFLSELMPEKFGDLLFRFSEGLQLVWTGQEGLDDSANARIYQARIIEGGVAANPFFGSGFLSAQWLDGFRTFFEQFHPSDNGFYGVIYVWGWFGLCVGLLQFLGIDRSALQNGEGNLVLQSLMIFYLYLVINSAATGRLIFSFDICVLVISLIRIVGRRPVYIAEAAAYPMRS